MGRRPGLSYREKRERGLCTYGGCERRAVAGMSRCEMHGEAARKWSRRRYHEKAAKGLCQCGACAVEGRVHCASCAAENRTLVANYQRTRIMNGCCCRCGVPRGEDGTSVYCGRCRRERNERRRKKT